MGTGITHQDCDTANLASFATVSDIICYNTDKVPQKEESIIFDVRTSTK
jgi:hypothetical protein